MPTEANAYHNLISDLESYLDREIEEWRNVGKTDHDFITTNALVDIKHEIERLKRLYLDFDSSARSKSSIS